MLYAQRQASNAMEWNYRGQHRALRGGGRPGSASSLGGTGCDSWGGKWVSRASAYMYCSPGPWNLNLLEACNALSAPCAAEAKAMVAASFSIVPGSALPRALRAHAWPPMRRNNILGAISEPCGAEARAWATCMGFPHRQGFCSPLQTRTLDSGFKGC